MPTNMPVVLTLDAGGNNFVFSAMQNNEEITDSFTLAAERNDLEKCLNIIIEGFENLFNKLDKEADAISFAFPGPADYENGIIGHLPNFPAFTKEGTALGPMLEERFKIPVFINNDGDLFAYGEALTGLMPVINKKLADAGSIKSHKNLIGITLGTGSGCGIVVNNTMLRGDNSCGAEIHNTLNKYKPQWNAEESVSERAIQRVYAEQAKLPFNDKLKPEEIYNIATGKSEGDTNAAKEAFRQFGENLGSSIANVVTLIDGIVALGGGITAAWELFAPAMFKELNRDYESHLGDQADRLSYKVFNLEDENTFAQYAKGGTKKLKVPGSDKTVNYDSLPRVGVGISPNGANESIALGAYAYAMQFFK